MDFKGLLQHWRWHQVRSFYDHRRAQSVPHPLSDSLAHGPQPSGGGVRGRHARVRHAHRIRTDNGTPFAGNGLLGLSELSLSWTKMGIVHERIQPGRPQQNGRHERMHRTLKEDTTKLPAQTLRLPQKKLDRFKRAGDGLQVTAQKMQVDRRVGELRMAERKRFLELMEAKHQTYL